MAFNPKGLFIVLVGLILVSLFTTLEAESHEDSIYEDSKLRLLSQIEQRVKYNKIKEKSGCTNFSCMKKYVLDIKASGKFRHRPVNHDLPSSSNTGSGVIDTSQSQTQTEPVAAVGSDQAGRQLTETERDKEVKEVEYVIKEAENLHIIEKRHADFFTIGVTDTDFASFPKNMGRSARSIDKIDKHGNSFDKEHSYNADTDNYPPPPKREHSLNVDNDKYPPPPKRENSLNVDNDEYPPPPKREHFLNADNEEYPPPPKREHSLNVDNDEYPPPPKREHSFNVEIDEYPPPPKKDHSFNIDTYEYPPPPKREYSLNVDADEYPPPPKRERSFNVDAYPPPPKAEYSLDIDGGAYPPPPKREYVFIGGIDEYPPPPKREHSFSFDTDEYPPPPKREQAFKIDTDAYPPPPKRESLKFDTGAYPPPPKREYSFNVDAEEYPPPPKREQTFNFDTDAYPPPPKREYYFHIDTEGYPPPPKRDLEHTYNENVDEYPSSPKIGRSVDKMSKSGASGVKVNEADGHSLVPKSGRSVLSESERYGKNYVPVEVYTEDDSVFPPLIRLVGRRSIDPKYFGIKSDAEVDGDGYPPPPKRGLSVSETLNKENGQDGTASVNAFGHNSEVLPKFGRSINGIKRTKRQLHNNVPDNKGSSITSGINVKKPLGFGSPQETPGRPKAKARMITTSSSNITNSSQSENQAICTTGTCQKPEGVTAPLEPIKSDKEKQEKEKQEKEIIEKEKERLEKEKEKIAKEKEQLEKEMEKLRKEKQEKEQLEKEMEKLKKEKQEKEQLEKEMEKLKKEKQEKEQLEKEMEKLKKEKQEKENPEKEKLEKEKLEKEKLEKEKQEKAKLEKEKQEKAKLEKEKLEKAKHEKEKLEKEKREKEKQEKEKLGKEKQEKEKFDKEKSEQSKTANQTESHKPKPFDPMNPFGNIISPATEGGTKSSDPFSGFNTDPFSAFKTDPFGSFTNTIADTKSTKTENKVFDPFSAFGAAPSSEPLHDKDNSKETHVKDPVTVAKTENHEKENSAKEKSEPKPNNPPESKKSKPFDPMNPFGNIISPTTDSGTKSSDPFSGFKTDPFSGFKSDPFGSLTNTVADKKPQKTDNKIFDPFSAFGATPSSEPPSDKNKSKEPPAKEPVTVTKTVAADGTRIVNATGTGEADVKANAGDDDEFDEDEMEQMLKEMEEVQNAGLEEVALSKIGNKPKPTNNGLLGGLTNALGLTSSKPKQTEPKQETEKSSKGGGGLLGGLVSALIKPAAPSKPETTTKAKPGGLLGLLG